MEILTQVLQNETAAMWAGNAIVFVVGAAMAWLGKRPKAKDITAKVLNLTGEGSEAVTSLVQLLADKDRTTKDAMQIISECKDVYHAVRLMKSEEPKGEENQ